MSADLPFDNPSRAVELPGRKRVKDVLRELDILPGTVLVIRGADLLTADEVVAITGHPVGGVCPFGLATPLPVYCDVSLKAFDEVVPAAGSTNSAVRIAPLRLAGLVGAEWVDVC